MCRDPLHVLKQAGRPSIAVRCQRPDWDDEINRITLGSD
jgi:hypothetical protein